MFRLLLRVVLAVVILGPFIFVSSPESVSPPKAGAPPGAGAGACSPSPSAEASIVASTNATRAARGLSKLRRDDHIGDAARSWSARMARSGAFEHSTLAWRRGRNAGENIAQAPSAGQAYQGLLDSPSHLENIVGRAWRFVGIGAVRCGGPLFVTMNLMAGPGIRA